MEKKMVTRLNKVIIVGGGPAGSAAGIALAKLGISSTIIEKQNTIRDKICGEFYSPECVSYLDQLGIRSHFFLQNPSSIKNINISFTGSPAATTLDSPAYGLSRMKFDSMLLNAAERNSVEVLRGYEVTDLYHKNNAFSLTVKNRSDGRKLRLSSQYVIGATGAKSNSESFFVESSANKSQTAYAVAFKFHARNTYMNNVIELYFTPYGYVGIGTIENDMVNVCGIIDRDFLKLYSGDIESVLHELSHHNSYLGERLNTMRSGSGSILCGNLSFGIRKPKYDDVLCIGDTAGSIHPFCGNGNAMALRSGLMSAEIIERGENNQWSVTRTAEHFRRMWKQEFSSRINVSSIIHLIAAGSITRRTASLVTNIYPGAINSVFKRTRNLKS